MYELQWRVMSNLQSMHGFRMARAGAWLTAVSAAVLLAACGGGGGDNTQVAAKVNKQEISIHQVNHVLSRQPGLKPEQVNVAAKRVLEGLVDQELAIQQAVDQKLDRDPRVVAAIEAARREILAKAYTDKLAETTAKPSDDEIRKYYEANPALFADRRIYALTEFTLTGLTAEQSKSVGGVVQTVKTAEEFAAAMNAAGLKFGQRSVQQAAENIPLAVLNALYKSGNKPLAVQGGGGMTVMVPVSTRPAPVTLEQAKGPIAQYLVNDRRRVLVNGEIKRLRESATIEYKGQFAAPAASAASS